MSIFHSGGYIFFKWDATSRHSQRLVLGSVPNCYWHAHRWGLIIGRRNQMLVGLTNRLTVTNLANSGISSLQEVLDDPVWPCSQGPFLGDSGAPVRAFNWGHFGPRFLSGVGDVPRCNISWPKYVSNIFKHWVPKNGIVTKNDRSMVPWPMFSRTWRRSTGSFPRANAGIPGLSLVFGLMRSRTSALFQSVPSRCPFSNWSHRCLFCFLLEYSQSWKFHFMWLPQTWCWFTIRHFPRSNLIPYPDENLLGHHPTVGCLDSFHKPFGNLKYPQKPKSLVGNHFFSAGFWPFWHLKLHNLHNTHHCPIFPYLFLSFLGTPLVTQQGHSISPRHVLPVAWYAPTSSMALALCDAPS